MREKISFCDVIIYAVIVLPTFCGTVIIYMKSEILIFIFHTNKYEIYGTQIFFVIQKLLEVLSARRFEIPNDRNKTRI